MTQGFSVIELMYRRAMIDRMVVSGCTPEWTYLGEDRLVLNQSHANVLREFHFLEEAPGVVQGFDLDNDECGGRFGILWTWRFGGPGG